MAITQCPRCNGIFNKMRSLVCQKCVSVEEEEYDKIRDVIAEEEDRTVDEVAELAEVKKTTVLRMLDLGLISDMRDTSITCGRCGAPAISAKRKLCEQCLGKLDQQVSQTRNKLLASVSTKPSTSVHSSLEAKRR